MYIMKLQRSIADDLSGTRVSGLRWLVDLRALE